MITQKKQALKRFTYLLCLSLSSIIITSDVQSMDSSEDKSDSYGETHNKIAAKYGLTQHIMHPKAHHQGPTLVGLAEEFKGGCKNVRVEEEKRLEEINALGTKVVERGGAIAEVVIDKNVKDEKVKNVLIQLKDDFTGYLKKAFSK